MQGNESRRAVPFVAALFAAALAGSGIAQSPTNLSVQLRAKEIERRLDAIAQIVAAKEPAGARLLQPLLRDDDWEVQEQIATALAELGDRASVPKLAELAVEGEVARVRRAAARATATLDAAAGAEQIWKKAKGKTQVAALEALALVLRARPQFAELDKLQKLLSDGNAAVREAASLAWLEGATDRAAALTALLGSQHLAVRCLALESVASAPRPEDLAPLVRAFGGEGQNDVVARRIGRALAAVLAAAEGDRAAATTRALDEAGTAEIPMARRARLIPLLCRGERPVLDAKAAVAALRPCLTASSGRVRAAAAKALREVGGEDALAAALATFDGEPDAHTQWQLVETVATLREPTTPAAVEWLVRIARSGADPDVRERAIVRLGRSGVKGASSALTELLADPRWQLACCAAVSLGKTDDDEAFDPLQNLLSSRDWKLRGAAVVGLMHWSRDRCVDPLLKMLDDPDPVVARAAHEALRTMSRHYDAAFDAKAWRAWWSQNRKNHDFTDREATLDKLNKYGYAVPDSEIYAGLDVVVFLSRGDHIEQLLDRLSIGYRKTEAGKVPEDGVHPEAIFVANCTGELAPDDVEPLEWFVRTGGSLFGSCWALSQTIDRLHPGVVQQAPTRDQVMDDVRALPCQPDSALLTGVFPPSVVPIYHLEGAHLIQVLDPERCEVLIDSPDAAERWGCGNLAAWFFSGHGVLFDSANHFDLQGLGVAGAGALKKAEERQAYAIDHLGMSFATWRENKGAAYWKNATKANASVPDLSAFRLLTNFVRSKRTGVY